ncbi:glycosyltransferase [Candidatus Woesearchaeota archaeon]|nr:glycosyltransferase [Candidatus Woesearchaeota archaeon]
MKKLLITSDCFLPRWDGIARFLADIIPELTKDFKVSVIAPEFPGTHKKVRGVKYHRFPLSKAQYGDIQFSQFNYRKVREIVAEHDIIFNQTIGPLGMSAIRAANKQEIPVVHYIHSIDWELASKGVKRFRKIVHLTIKRLVRYFHNKCTLLLVPSRAVEDKIVQNNVKTPRLLLPMGIDTKKFKPSKNKAKSKERIGIPRDKFVIGFVGRIGREKDLPTLYKAYRTFTSPGHTYRLLIVGGGLQDEVPDDQDVILKGSQDDVTPYLQAMDVFVLPSLTETSSLATMEAMATALPVIVTPVGNIPEYVDDDYNGILFPRQDAQALAEKLRRVVMDSELRERLGKAARNTIVKRHSWRVTVKRLRKVLLEI